MPIKLPKNFPAKENLEKEGIESLSFTRAQSQDIRPLRIALLNLMPTKVATETQILRLLSSSSIQIEAYFLKLGSHKTKYGEKHLNQFYVSFDDVKNQFFDGLIITGAPVEQLDYEDVDYFSELKTVLSWAKNHVFSRFYICWGAQAGLFVNYGVNKVIYDHKVFGVYHHKVTTQARKCNHLTRGFDDEVMIPHSRHSGVNQDQIDELIKNKTLHCAVYSDELGPVILATNNIRDVYLIGHMEYDKETLDIEYKRDLEKGQPISVPKNYYIDDNPNLPIIRKWCSHANLLFNNWIDFVYQSTPYSLEELPQLSIN